MLPCTGKWLRVNQRLCELLGYSREDLQGPNAAETHPIRTSWKVRKMLFVRWPPGTLTAHVIDEKRYRRRDGTPLWARVNISLLRDASGQPQHFIEVIEDITERRTLEAQIRQAGKMDAIGRLASGVAHDFNNLLTVILGFAEILTTDVSISPSHAEDLSEIVKAANRATALTKQLLAFGRQQVLVPPRLTSTP